MKKAFDLNQYESNLFHALMRMVTDDPENYTALIELGRLVFKLEMDRHERETRK